MGYPTTRDQLFQAARRNDAPAEVLEEIRGMPDQDYGAEERDEGVRVEAMTRPSDLFRLYPYL